MKDCNKCLWASRNGNCVSWECNFVDMAEAYRAYCMKQTAEFINRPRLIEQLERLEKFNNSDVPEWVYKVIGGM